VKGHQNPREGIRINLPFEDAVRRALKTPPNSDAELLKKIRADRRPARRPKRRTTPR
jgi:hypothetical protein